METGEFVSFNGNKRFPMQSVYKVPIAMVMLHQVDAGKFSLTDTIPIAKTDIYHRRAIVPCEIKAPTEPALL
jgi:beta-lactamase class A